MDQSTGDLLRAVERSSRESRMGADGTRSTPPRTLQTPNTGFSEPKAARRETQRSTRRNEVVGMYTFGSKQLDRAVGV